MEKYLPYFLSANILLLLHIAYYQLFLSRLRRFSWNRAYLLAGIGMAALLPLLRFEVVPPTLPDPSFIRTLPEILIVPAQAQGPSLATSSWTAMDYLVTGYVLGVLVSLFVLLFRNLAILRLIWNGQKSQQGAYTLVYTKAPIGPASYFRYIFWQNNHGLDAQSEAVALAHERLHSRQLHTLDLLLVEFIKAFCWFNPAIYFLRKHLRQTHEYLADQAALEIAGAEGIKRLMMMRHLGTRHFALANYFHSHIKTRIQMLTDSPKTKAIARYALVLPLAALMVACTSFGHPLESTEGYMPVDSPTVVASATTAPEAAENASFINFDEMFLNAEIALMGEKLQQEGTVCMGVEPPILNLDSALSGQEGPGDSENQPIIKNIREITEKIGYPKAAEDQKITGKVMLKILVDEGGYVMRYIVLEPSHPLLLSAVEEHVKELRFRPGLKEGKLAKWWVVVPFRFGLGGC